MKPENICGLILAGGLSRRLGGGDKALMELAGRPLLSYAIDRAMIQVDHLIINANGDAARFSAYDLPVIGDVIDGYAGPLAGVLTGLEWMAEHHADCQWLATFATDAPFFPVDLVERLLGQIRSKNADMACALSNGRTHPVFALWPVALKKELHQAMIDEDMRKVDRWTARYKTEHVNFANDENGVDPFFNINVPENFIDAETVLKGDVN